MVFDILGLYTYCWDYPWCSSSLGWTVPACSTSPHRRDAPDPSSLSWSYIGLFPDVITRRRLRFVIRTRQGLASSTMSGCQKLAASFSRASPSFSCFLLGIPRGGCKGRGQLGSSAGRAGGQGFHLEKREQSSALLLWGMEKAWRRLNYPSALQLLLVVG